MASYPLLLTSLRKVDENLREGANKMAGDPTDRSCSRNVFTWQRGSVSISENSGAEVGREEYDELSESEVKQDSWRDEEQWVIDAVHTFMDGLQAMMAHTSWKNKGEDVVCEARVVKMGGMSKKLVAYFLYGEGRTATLAEWQ